MSRTLSYSLPSAVIFDMDGLKFDTEAIYQKALLSLAAERSIDSITQAKLDQTVGLSWAGTRALLQRLLPPSVELDEIIGAWSDRYLSMTETELALKPGVLELIEMLEVHGVCKAVATGSHQEVTTRHLAAYGLDLRFDAVIAREDCANGKPAPDPFLISADRLGVDPTQCWALEDSINGVRSAYEAGMQVIMVPDLVQPDQHTAAICNHIATSLHDVVDLIQERALT